MQVKQIFVDRHGETRSGWRIAIFLFITSCLAFLLFAPFQYFNVLSLYVQTVCSLVATLAATFVMTRFINHKPFTAIGLSLHPAMFRELGMGCLLGFLMMTGIFLIEYAGGFVAVSWRGLTILDCLGVFLSAAGLFVLAAFFEELLFRGYLFQTLTQAVTVLPAMLIMALLFAYAHFDNPNATTFGLVNVALAAVWLSLAYMKTRSLWFPLGLHFAWNFSQTTLYGFPTSGVDFSDKQFLELAQGGPDWVTGGPFGPEGGALATMALVICIWYILKEKQLSVPQGIITLDSVEDLVKPDVTGGSCMKRLFEILLCSIVLHPIMQAQSTATEEQMFDARTQQGIEYVYNLEFEKAEREFGELIHMKPEHPAGHFFLAMVQWWRILIDIDNEQFDGQFYDSLQNVIDLCDELLDKNENDVTALFFKGGAIGFRGRLRTHRSDWLAAANDGRKALPIVQDAASLDPANNDILLGSGIYDYYAEVIPQEYPFVKPLLLFVPPGDKKRGIQSLMRGTSEKGKYAGIEATYFLMQIYLQYEKEYQKALAIATTLTTRFPNNVLFQKYLGRCYVSLGNWQMVHQVFADIAGKVHSGQRGYGAAVEREAEYYLAFHEMSQGSYEAALPHYYRCDELSRRLDVDGPSGFMVMANLKIGMIYDLLAKRDLAVAQYRKVLAMKEYKDSYRQAEQFLKTPYMQ